MAGRTVYRNSPRLPEIRKSHTDARRYDPKAGKMVRCDPAEVWEEFETNPGYVMLEEEDSGVFTLYPGRGYRKLFWELRLPTRAPEGTFLDYLLDDLPVVLAEKLRQEIEELVEQGPPPAGPRAVA